MEAQGEGPQKEREGSQRKGSGLKEDVWASEEGVGDGRGL